LKIEKISKKLNSYVLQLDSNNSIIYNSKFNYVVTNGVSIYLDQDFKNYLTNKLEYYSITTDDQRGYEVKYIIDNNVSSEYWDEFNEVILMNTGRSEIMHSRNEWKIPYEYLDVAYQALNTGVTVYAEIIFYADSDDFIDDYISNKNKNISTISRKYKISEIIRVPKYTMEGIYYMYELITDCPKDHTAFTDDQTFIRDFRINF
jgi:hypothetical protein